MAPFRFLLAWRLADMRGQGSPLLNRFSMLMVGGAFAGCTRPKKLRGQDRSVSELQP